MKIIIVMVICIAVLLIFGSASIGMWDEQVHLVKSPNGEVVCAYVKAVGMTGHKKFLSEREVIKFNNFSVIEYKTEEYEKEIIALSGSKAWIEK